MDDFFTLRRLKRSKVNKECDFILNPLSQTMGCISEKYDGETMGCISEKYDAERLMLLMFYMFFCVDEKTHTT
jgi:hypothetical protein